MNCKCKICGKTLNTKTAYMIARGNNRSYYCSKEEYDLGVEAFNKKQELENKLYDLIKEIIGTRKLMGDPLETLNDKISLLKEVCSTEELIFYIEKKKNWLYELIKERTSGFSAVSKIKYLCKVIQNRISDWELDYKEERKYPNPINGFDSECYTISAGHNTIKKRRRSLSDLEDELGR